MGGQNEWSAKKTSSTCSSRSSHTDNSDNDSENDSENDSDYDSEDGSNSITSSMSDEEEQVFAHIEDFPVDMICLESCKDTLDSYMMGQDVEPDEWLGILMQVIMQAYQRLCLIK